MSLSNVLEIINEIGNVSSRLAKEEIIKNNRDNKEFERVVKYALNPFWQYNTKRINFQKNLPKEFINEYMDETHDNIFRMLDYLSEKKGATDDEISWLSAFSSYDKETYEVIKKIINKDLRCGASIKTFKKYFPDLPEFGVMLCKKDVNKFLKFCNYDMTQAVYSIKLNGVRCLANNGVYLSRSGKEYPNFNIFDKELKKFDEIGKRILPNIFENKSVIKDGEVMAIGENKRTFQKLMKQIRRLDEIDNTCFKFHIFDLVDDLNFIDRYKIIYNVFNKAKEQGIEFKYIDYLPHYHCSSKFKTEDDIWDYVKQIKQDGEEGIVIKHLNSPYERKYSKHWCKVKLFDTLDCKVTGFEYGKGKYINCIGALKCQLKNGTKFNVSGLSDKQRTEFMDNLPQVIEIKYQEWSDDNIPVFATFVSVRNDKDITDID